jgi:hypothetical protein
MSDAVEHFDKLGQKIEVGDYVAYSSHNSLDIGLVQKLNPKMVKVSRLGKKGWGSGTNKYPTDCVLLDGKRVTLYVLKNSGG